MTKKNILIVTASDGKNLEMANELYDISKDYEANFEVVKLNEYNLPLYTSAQEAIEVPDSAKELTQKFIQANGFIFLAPEYNGSTPPSFPNAIAWISRSGNEDWRLAFNEKPAVIGTHSGGGGNHVLVAMEGQLSFIGCNIIGRKLLTSYSKTLNPDSAKNVMGQLIKYINA